MRTNQKLLLDMIKAIETISSYGLNSRDELEADGKTQDAIMFNLIII